MIDTRPVSTNSLPRIALGALRFTARMPPGVAQAIFAVARSAGWIAHAAEEFAERPLRFRGRTVRRRAL